MHNAPYDLGIDSGGDGFPVSGPAPRLSWKPPSDAARPVAYEVACTVDGEARAAGAVAHLVLARGSGLRLGVASACTDNGAPLDQEAVSTASARLWTITKIN